MNESATRHASGSFRRNPDLIGAAVDDELVMMSVEHGQYYGLGGVGPRVWELIEEPRTFGELVNQILEEFEVKREVCEKDMMEFLAQMEKLGLVERV
ncbi:MAG: lasso peptide biosynthesis PqqD family chaperone [Wenzhouxiangella sp.]|nr:MAG: lasso peptide biosynthesis PqqD family chaperone [Wenzhouxiangella sp.]